MNNHEERGKRLPPKFQAMYAGLAAAVDRLARRGQLINMRLGGKPSNAPEYRDLRRAASTVQAHQWAHGNYNRYRRAKVRRRMARDSRRANRP